MEMAGSPMMEREKGTAALEQVVILPLLLLVFFGGAQLLHWAFAVQTVRAAAAGAAREQMVRTQAGDAATLARERAAARARERLRAGGLSPGLARVSARTGGEGVEVVVEQEVPTFAPFALPYLGRAYRLRAVAFAAWDRP